MLDIRNLKDLDAMKISVASPEEIKGWSYGEITKPETINYRTFKPERDGLFDEKIFGPSQDFICACGKYKGVRFKGVICDKCGVEVTHSRVRRERMGHIELAAPVAHVWYFKGIPSKIATLLDISPKNLDAVIYFSSFIITEADLSKKTEVISEIEKEIQKINTSVTNEVEEEIKTIEKEIQESIKIIPSDIKDEEKLEIKKEEIRLKGHRKISKLRNDIPKAQQKAERKLTRIKKKIDSMERLSIMTDSEYYAMTDYIEKFATIRIGAEAVKQILEKLDLLDLASKLKKSLEKAKGQNLIKITKRLKIVEGFRRANIKPEWMIMTTIPVIPPEIRPMVQLEGGRFATSDLNDLYRRVINRNNRLKRLISIGAPDIITRNEKRMLQEAVDALIDSSKSRRSNRLSRGSKQLKSLSDMIKGKQGRFRQNLLGKRVDYSGRAVIVVGPELNIDECGIPKRMAVELYKPFVLRELLVRGHAPNIKTAKILIDEGENVVFDVLEDVVKDRPVMLNRAPTLHKLGIQGFYPKLIEGNAIRLHPLVCVGFNADFDGDQMAVHLPISKEAVNEIKTTIMSNHNFLKPAAGEFIALATRDMYLGTYYITHMESDKPKIDKVYTSQGALIQHQFEKLTINEPIYVQIGQEKIVTSVGRIIFNEILPEDYEFINRVIEKNQVKNIVEDIYEKYSNQVVSKFLDDVKRIGFRYATISGLSVAMTDIDMVPEREDIIKNAESEITEIEQNYYRGLITKEEFKSLSQGVWTKATDELDTKTWENLAEDNPLKIMVNAGAGKASQAQIKQIAGMKGLVIDPNGRLVDLPIRSNYKIGLTSFECFNASRGARKGLTDKGLKTADAGYLTRRLVDVAQDIVVREEDCGTTFGRVITSDEKTSLSSYTDRIKGRYLLKDVKNNKGKVIAKANELITEEISKKIEESGVKELEIRSPITCETRYGVCTKCYGIDLSNLKPVEIGTALGIRAAQAIGEPGTQLTMKTFHAGGIAGRDITMGLPRVEEIFEARKPKSIALMAEISGKISIEEEKDGSRTLKVISTDPNAEMPEIVYNVEPSAEILVKNGELVNVGNALTFGYLDLNDLFSSIGITETQKYIIDQVQKAYSSQGVLLDDKHIEVIVRQMFNKVEIVDIGDTGFLPGEIVTNDLFQETNERIVAAGGIPAQGRVILLGISKSALNTDSFLSAASFQETTRILADAACRGSIDKLMGLKENVIIGKLIPVGTGFRQRA